MSPTQLNPLPLPASNAAPHFPPHRNHSFTPFPSSPHTPIHPSPPRHQPQTHTHTESPPHTSTTSFKPPFQTAFAPLHLTEQLDGNHPIPSHPSLPFSLSSTDSLQCSSMPFRSPNVINLKITFTPTQPSKTRKKKKKSARKQSLNHFTAPLVLRKTIGGEKKTRLSNRACLPTTQLYPFVRTRSCRTRSLAHSLTHSLPAYLLPHSVRP